jgi:hypothetical protein
VVSQDLVPILTSVPQDLSPPQQGRVAPAVVVEPASSVLVGRLGPAVRSHTASGELLPPAPHLSTTPVRRPNATPGALPSPSAPAEADLRALAAAFLPSSRDEQHMRWMSGGEKQELSGKARALRSNRGISVRAKLRLRLWRDDTKLNEQAVVSMVRGRSPSFE